MKETATKTQQQELNELKKSVEKILNDYKQTALTLDEVTAAVDGVSATNHAENVDKLSNELLTDIQQVETRRVWEQEGYNSKTEWLNDT
jgi:hypothetical protein